MSVDEMSVDKMAYFLSLSGQISFVNLRYHVSSETPFTPGTYNIKLFTIIE